MRAGSAIASSGRHAVEVGLQALIIAAIIATVALAMSAVYKPAGFVAGLDTADAATAPTGTIALAGSTTARTGSQAYGDKVAFETSVSGRLAPKSRVYVSVICEQNGLIVYQWSADPSFDFPLVQQDGLKALGYVWDPTQDATCSGTLVYREESGKTSKIIHLDKVGFATVGS